MGSFSLFLQVSGFGCVLIFSYFVNDINIFKRVLSLLRRNPGKKKIKNETALSNKCVKRLTFFSSWNKFSIVGRKQNISIFLFSVLRPSASSRLQVICRWVSWRRTGSGQRDVSEVWSLVLCCCRHLADFQSKLRKTSVTGETCARLVSVLFLTAGQLAMRNSKGSNTRL